jgi:hypothetical protein
MERIFADTGVSMNFRRTRSDACSINLIRGKDEIELLLWESGLAELAVGTLGGHYVDRHIPDLRNKDELVAVMTILTSLVVDLPQRAASISVT